MSPADANPPPAAAWTPCEGGAGGRTWLISFADLVSLLLTFMIMLFAQSDADHKQAWREAAIAFARHLAWPEEPAAQPGAPSGPPRAPVLLDLNYLALVLPATLAGEPALAAAALDREADRLILAIPASRLFAPGGMALTPDGMRALASLARVLSGLSNRLAIDAALRAPDEIRTSAPGRAMAASDPLASEAWDAALSRAIAIATALGRAGLGRPIACRAVADAPDDRMKRGHAPGASPAAEGRIELVVFASAEE